jgi:FkbM family methyltransferase
MDKVEMLTAPMWVRVAGAMIRRLPAGRYRVINKICRRPPSAFLMPLPAEMGGFTFKCDLRDTISREVCFTGRYEPQETALVQSILRPGMTFVDVGANWGYFTLLAAHLVGKAGRVVSLEPDPRLFPILQESIVRNYLEQVTVLQVAAASEEGTLKLAGYNESGDNFGISRIVCEGEQESTFDVIARPLDKLFDDLGLHTIDLLKMDIEGFEWYALSGLENSLSHLRIKRLLIELHPAEIAGHGQSLKEIIGQLRGFGYRPWQLDHSKAASRRAAYGKSQDLNHSLRPFDERAGLDDWPHLLWTMPGLEALW